AATIDSARRALNPWRPAEILPYLARAARLLGPDDAEQRALLERAIAVAARVAIDGTADDGIIVAGQRVQVEVTVWNGGGDAVRLDSVELRAPGGWRVTRFEPAAAAVAPGTVATRRFAVVVAPDAERTQPYFLRRPRLGAGRGLYDWTGVPATVRGLAFEPPPLAVRARLTIAGVPVVLTREVVFRYRDQAVGEVRRPIFVTRDFDVAIAPDEVLWPVNGGGADGAARAFTVTVTNRRRGPATAPVVVTAPRGWPPVPAESLAFGREDESRTITVALSPPPADVRPGGYELRVRAERNAGGLVVIDYPHIRPRALVRPSDARIVAAPLLLPPLSRVGYVRGAADRVPEALISAGVPLELLDAADLESGDLSHYDAIVVGSRAYETDAALIANNARLLEYARAGGLVIVQYQQYAFIEGGYAPYPLRISRPHDRVTDETAPVTALDPEHRVLNYPNAIGPGDWRGWVQERGLYFARDWDSTYMPILETHDSAANATALQGGLLIAPLGRGTYVYTGLSFFRQLPAGVPGAFRLFVNLLGLRRRNVP
ncbi:MAG: NEW3 domain-containing protein, partial [Gemmatimonadales bacterium]